MPRVRELLDSRIAGSFVGRLEELGSLLELLTDQGPVVVHLHGIAGVGKSRLLGAFAERADSIMTRWAVAASALLAMAIILGVAAIVSR